MAPFCKPPTPERGGSGIVGTWRNTQGDIMVFGGDGSFKISQTQSINGNPGTMSSYGTYSFDTATQTLSYTIQKMELTGTAGYDTTKDNVNKSYSQKLSVSGGTLTIGGVTYTR